MHTDRAAMLKWSRAVRRELDEQIAQPALVADQNNYAVRPEVNALRLGGHDNGIETAGVAPKGIQWGTYVYDRRTCVAKLLAEEVTCAHGIRGITAEEQGRANAALAQCPREAFNLMLPSGRQVASFTIAMPYEYDVHPLASKEYLSWLNT